MPRMLLSSESLGGKPRAFAGPRGVALEWVLLAVSLFWAVLLNRPFFAAALHGQAGDSLATWGFGLALLVMLVGVHALLLALVCHRFTAKPLLALLLCVAAASSFFIGAFNVYLDPSMLRNVLRTDVHEASELLSLRFLGHLLLYAGLPLLLLWRLPIKYPSLGRALLRRLSFMLLCLVLAVAALMSVFQPMASLMRNQKELRYLITPANALYSTGRVLASEAQGAAKPRVAIGQDAQLVGPAPTRPRLVVLVVGETARAANWGLNGYARQTTPQLAQWAQEDAGLINFPHVTACGTNTETSVPCMFAPVGRRDYDEDRIRGSQSLLHVLAKAGVAVHWRDNQSGCKGVCEGLPNDETSAAATPALCPDGRCLDEALLAGLPERLAKAQGTQLLVLHMLGNHGPSYFRRYPPAFAKFTPECRQDDLRQCSTEQITASYDNALLYTDHVLAALLKQLKAAQDTVDTALIYVSDHGESLGEKGLFLHGIPYAIAPQEQLRVPMVMWFSQGMAASRPVEAACVRERAKRPAAHDHLFHTLLTLLNVRTALHAPTFDLLSGCLNAPPPDAATPATPAATAPVDDAAANAAASATVVTRPASGAAR
jgi:lipid A ethanolaminephosphotransferase